MLETRLFYRIKLTPAYDPLYPLSTDLCLEYPVHEASGSLVIASVVLPSHDQKGQAILQDAVDEWRH